MIGAISLWNQRRKIRGSVSRDLLQNEDPTPWLSEAASTLHLRTSCPHPAWLVHCAYWAEVRQAPLLAAVLRGAEHMRVLAGGEPAGTILEWPLWPLPDLADKIHGLEKMYPVLRGFEQSFCAQWNLTLENHLGRWRQPRPFEDKDFTPEVLTAGGFHLAIAAIFHASAGLRESLAVTASGMFALFAMARPSERATLLAIQRASYGWPLSMTATSFVK